MKYPKEIRQMYKQVIIDQLAKQTILNYSDIDRHLKVSEGYTAKIMRDDSRAIPTKHFLPICEFLEKNNFEINSQGLEKVKSRYYWKKKK